jgi:hypothetical protein
MSLDAVEGVGVGSEIGEGRAQTIQIKELFMAGATKKKRGVPRHHGNMLPGNSFPQICVVSVNIIVENSRSHKGT